MQAALPRHLRQRRNPRQRFPQGIVEHTYCLGVHCWLKRGTPIPHNRLALVRLLSSRPYATRALQLGKSDVRKLAGPASGAAGPLESCHACFNFHSARHDWLEISSTRAQYKGTLNGSEVYGFIRTFEGDRLNGCGSINKLWIKIRDRRKDIGP